MSMCSLVHAILRQEGAILLQPHVESAAFRGLIAKDRHRQTSGGPADAVGLRGFTKQNVKPISIY
eukprot:scaffold47009_cov20-Tisochrysis_lutea.AAC.2